jgi:hypothetical protein
VPRIVFRMQVGAGGRDRGMPEIVSHETQIHLLPATRAPRPPGRAGRTRRPSGSRPSRPLAAGLFGKVCGNPLLQLHDGLRHRIDGLTRVIPKPRMRIRARNFSSFPSLTTSCRSPARKHRPAASLRHPTGPSSAKSLQCTEFGMMVMGIAKQARRGAP